MLDRIEIRPPKRANVVKFLALEAFLIPACLFCAFGPNNLFIKIFGAFGLLFFGVGGFLGLCAMLARTWSFAVSAEGIEVNGNSLPLIGTRVRRIVWHDVDAIGIADVAGQSMVGLRLSSPDAYLTSGGDPMSSRRNQARRRLMQTNRGLCGYDLAFGWSELDRSPSDMVDLLTRYRQAAMPGSPL